jgi:hypothetical protein
VAAVVLLPLLAVVIGRGAAATGDTSGKSADDELVRIFDKEDVTLAELLDTMAGEFGIGLVITPAVHHQLDKMTMRLSNISTIWVKGSDRFEALRAVLKTVDLVLVRIGPDSCPLYEVVNIRSGSARQEIVPQAPFVKLEDIGRYSRRHDIVRVAVPLRHMSAARARTELNNLVSPLAGSLNPVLSTNTVVVTDFGANVVDIVRMLQAMDERVAETEGAQSRAGAKEAAEEDA